MGGFVFFERESMTGQPRFLSAGIGLLICIMGMSTAFAHVRLDRLIMAYGLDDGWVERTFGSSMPWVPLVVVACGVIVLVRTRGLKHAEPAARIRRLRLNILLLLVSGVALYLHTASRLEQLRDL